MKDLLDDLPYQAQCRENKELRSRHPRLAHQDD
jgi:hypothetical protein